MTANSTIAESGWRGMKPWPIVDTRSDAPLISARTYGSAIPAIGSAASNIDRLLVMREFESRNRDLVERAGLLASAAEVRRAVLLGFALEDAALLRDAGIGSVRVSTPSTLRDAIALANESSLVLTARRSTAPGLRSPLGRNARHLLRRSRTPLLIAGRTPLGAYTRAVIATDLETDLGAALAWTKRIAPSGSATLLHVYHGLFEGRLLWAGVPDEAIARHRVVAQGRAVDGMKALLNRHARMRPKRSMVAHGLPLVDVAARARELEADLIVVVKNNHSWWADALGASVSLETAMRADCDVLVLHGESKDAAATTTHMDAPR